ncbi:MAG: hypothetical protein KU37_08100 [Sulfuricurvum sp. PC08-66]|nr:MAG: hypothetical protein KU37_08100 [Sulfuricurvum sp. PC08-66]
MSSEILDTFNDQLISDSARMESLIIGLEKSESFFASVNALFRIFHNFKASAGYLKLNDIFEISAKAETILNTVRQEGRIIDKSLIDWLFDISDLFATWADQTELNQPLSPLKPALLRQIRTHDSGETVAQVLKRLNVLLIDKSDDGVKLAKSFGTIFNRVMTSDTTKNFEAYLAKEPHLLFIDQSYLEELGALQKILESRKIFMPIVALCQGKPVHKRVLELSKRGVQYQLERPLTSANLKKILYSMVKTHFSKQKAIITNKKIQHFIDQLQPLNATVIQIQNICDDPNTSIRELARVVQNDPVTSGILLNATQSPMFALKKINSVDQAVAIFGKRMVKALTLGGLKKDIGKTDLSMYGMTESQFSDVANMRMTLMNNWFVKGHADWLSTLSITSLLGNIGQMLLAKELLAQGKAAPFKAMLATHTIAECEEEFLRTTTTSVSADIAYYWKLNSVIIDSLAFADSPREAVNDIKPFAVANYVVFKLVPQHRAQIGEITPDIIELLEEVGLPLGKLKTAIEKTKDNMMEEEE